MITMFTLKLAFLLFATLSVGYGYPERRKESGDSFRRLLRRSAIPAESDVTLIRQERGLNDDFENDDFVTRKRRSDEDKFYQTLLTRAESRQQDKRSFDTDDVDSKAGFIIREDWTGDSKISDADRKELENLFESLSPDDPEKTKQDETRAAEKEPEGVEAVAKDYTDWLMSQPPSQMTAALTHKVDVDHKLSKLFYRSAIPGHPCIGKNPRCTCFKTCHPYPVVNFSPCHCSASMPKAPGAKKAATKSIVNTAAVETGGKLLPKMQPRPMASGPALARQLQRQANISPVNLPPICTDNSPECICRKTCFPKPVATATPCNCGLDSAAPPPPPPAPPSPAPAPIVPSLKFKPQAAVQKPANPAIQRALVNVNAALAKLCKQDSPQCLCARACYPQPIVSAHPCQCLQGANGPNKPAPPSGPPRPSAPNAAPVGATTTDSGSSPISDNAGAPEQNGILNAPAQPAAIVPPAQAQKAEIDWCKRACHPRPVSKADPCNCEAPVPAPAPAPAPEPAPAPSRLAPPPARIAAPPARIAAPPARIAPPPAPLTAPIAPNAATANAVAEHACRRTCFPNPVASTNPCNCSPDSPPPAPAPAPAPSPAPAVATGRQPAPSMWLPGSPLPAKPHVPYYNPAWKASAVSNGAPISQTPFSRYSIHPPLANPLTAPKREGVQATDMEQNGPIINKLPGHQPQLPLKPYLSEGSLSYQGCYKDRKPGRDLPRRYTRYDQMTPETCVAECKYQGYKFAGLQYSYLCFCGNGFGRYGREPDLACNSKCVGDRRRFCGSFWHNSVYSVSDDKKYDPTEFDFQKIDADEAKKDQLTQGPKPPAIDTSRFPSRTSASVAGHLMKAAEAALKAANHLLVSSAKNSALRKKGVVKREDDENYSLIEQEKMASMASLRVARQLMDKQAFKEENKPAPKEKRSIEVEEDSFVDIDNGKDMLVAYLGSMESYKREVRGLDDNEDESGSGASDDIPDVPKFEYKRLNLDQKEDNGEFVEKYEEPDIQDDDKERRSAEKERRSSEKEGKGEPASDKKEQKRVVVVNEVKEGMVSGKKEPRKSGKSKRELGPIEGLEEDLGSKVAKESPEVKITRAANGATGKSEDSRPKREAKPAARSQSLGHEGTGFSKNGENLSIAKREVGSKGTSEDFNHVQQHEVFNSDSPLKRDFLNSAPPSVDPESSAPFQIIGEAQEVEPVTKRAKVSDEPSAKTKRSLAPVKTTATEKAPNSKATLTEKTKEENKRNVGDVAQVKDEKVKVAKVEKRNAVQQVVKVSSKLEAEKPKDRKSRRSLEDSALLAEIEQYDKMAGFGANDHEEQPHRRSRRSLEGDLESEGSINKANVERGKTSANTVSLKTLAQPNKVRRHIAVPMHELEDITKHRRDIELETAMRTHSSSDDPYTRQKRDMSDDGEQEPDGVKKMAARADKSIDVQSTLEPMEEKRSLDGKGIPEEGDSGSSDADFSGSGSGILDDPEDMPNKRSLRGTDDNDEVKLSNASKLNSSLSADSRSKIHDHVSKGVENLLKLVVNLYREQATIKSFEDSVRTLKNDILSELNVPKDQKEIAMRELRDEIKKTAAKKLEDLTTSIRDEIKSYSANPGIASSKISTAVDLIPDLPINDKKLADTKREIRKRAAELDSVEDQFAESKIPDVLREHFKRNSDGEAFKGEQMLSRNHRDVANEVDFDEAFKRFTE